MKTCKDYNIKKCYACCYIIKDSHGNIVEVPCATSVNIEAIESKKHSSEDMKNHFLGMILQKELYGNTIDQILKEIISIDYPEHLETLEKILVLV